VASWDTLGVLVSRVISGETAAFILSSSFDMGTVEDFAYIRIPGGADISISRDSSDPDATLSGFSKSKLFVVDGSSHLRLHGVTIRDGYHQEDCFHSNGGAVFVNEGGNVEFTDCTFTNNTAVL
jgi:hypothetical protein